MLLLACPSFKLRPAEAVPITLRRHTRYANPFYYRTQNFF